MTICTYYFTLRYLFEQSFHLVSTRLLHHLGNPRRFRITNVIEVHNVMGV